MKRLVLVFMLVVCSVTLVAQFPLGRWDFPKQETRYKLTATDWDIRPAPKELPAFKLYTYTGSIPPGSPCEWIQRGGTWTGGVYYTPKPAVDAKRLSGEIVKRCKYPEVKASWEDVLRSSIGSLVHEPDTYRDYDNLREVMVAYGLLQAGNNPTFDRSLAFSENFRRGTIKRIVQSSVFRNVVYNWAMPSVQKAFRGLHPEDQQEYLRMLEHAEQYLGRFDYTTESQYWDDLSKKNTCWQKEWRASRGWKSLPHHMTMPNADPHWQCETLFTLHNPDGTVGPYRKIEAFIFRRYNQDGVGVETQRYWVRRAIADLQSAAAEK